ncbi:MAG: 50S ribosomal protein L3 [Actinobacteria bacterium]|nr:50S ribosomal protein L3 [Actinomycetota bacterium]
MATKAIVGEKVGMTQVWDDQNRVVPVTVLKVAPVRIVQVKTQEADGYTALQVAMGEKNQKKLNKPEAGHYKKADVQPGVRLVELRLDDVSAYEVGQEIAVDLLAAGDLVDVTAVSKGKGFAGVMKRHNFAGQRASHGVHRVHRAPGAIGACATPSRVFRGTKMAGRMGGEKVTTLNLKVVEANVDNGLLLVRGSVPGPRGAVVVIRDAVKAASNGRGES